MITNFTITLNMPCRSGESVTVYTINFGEINFDGQIVSRMLELQNEYLLRSVQTPTNFDHSRSFSLINCFSVWNKSSSCIIVNTALQSFTSFSLSHRQLHQLTHLIAVETMDFP